MQELERRQSTVEEASTLQKDTKQKHPAALQNCTEASIRQVAASPQQEPRYCPNTPGQWNKNTKKSNPKNNRSTTRKSTTSTATNEGEAKREERTKLELSLCLHSNKTRKSIKPLESVENV